MGRRRRSHPRAHRRVCISAWACFSSAGRRSGRRGCGVKQGLCPRPPPAAPRPTCQQHPELVRGHGHGDGRHRAAAEAEQQVHQGLAHVPQLAGAQRVVHPPRDRVQLAHCNGRAGSQPPPPRPAASPGITQMSKSNPNASSRGRDPAWPRSPAPKIVGPPEAALTSQAAGPEALLQGALLLLVGPTQPRGVFCPRKETTHTQKAPTDASSSPAVAKPQACGNRTGPKHLEETPGADSTKGMWHREDEDGPILHCLLSAQCWQLCCGATPKPACPVSHLWAAPAAAAHWTGTRHPHCAWLHWRR